MTVTAKYQELRARAKERREQEGVWGLLKSGIRLAYSPVFKSESFWLYEYRTRPEYKASEPGARVSPDRLDFKVVESNEAADRLEAEGFRFRSYPTYFNLDLKAYTWWLKCGAIACCTFVDREFAAVNWVIASQRTQTALKEIPVRVDYAGGEAMPRSAWVNEKHRGLELYRYTLHRRDEFFQGRGIRLWRYTIDYRNKVGIGMHEALGARRYGRGRLIRIFGRRFWKESHFAVAAS